VLKLSGLSAICSIHAKEAYLSIDVTKVKYIIRKLSVDGKEIVITRIRPNNFKSYKSTHTT
jgi:hypothetical protein